MRLVRFSVEGVDRFGIETDGGIRDLSELRKEFPDFVALLDGEKRTRLAKLADSMPSICADNVTFLPPIATGAKIFCVGVNYMKRHPIAGAVTSRPLHPTIFVKTVEALAGHCEAIEYPTGLSEQLDYEGELALVLGKGGRHIALEDAMSYVAGYTILNDGSVRDWQKISLYTGKNFFRASSCGPAIVTADEVADAMNLTLVTRINGKEVQRTNTGLMLFNPSEIISHISKFTTLAPGDVVATGSPDGAGGSMTPPCWLKPGDRIEVEISEIGMLSNVVRRRSDITSEDRNIQ